MKETKTTIKNLNSYIYTFFLRTIKVYAGVGTVIFIVLLVSDLCFSNTGYFTVKGLRLSFLVTTLFTAAFMLFLSSKKKLNINILITAVIFTGITLRVCYMLYTGAGTRTYDVYRVNWGHLDYIKYIAYHFSLPPVNECQAYHPPVHHIVSAFALNLGRLLTGDWFKQLKFVQAATAFLNIMTLVFFYKILKQMNCSKVAILAGISLFAFHPTNIYFSSRINNDNTMFFFYVLAFYFLLRWIHSKTVKNILALAFFSSIAALTKLSAVMILPIIGVVFVSTLFDNQKKYKTYLKQFSIFCFIYFPLSLSYQIRNYILFGQKFGYVPSFGQGFSPTIYNLLYIPVSNIIKDPFNNGGIQGGEYFLEFLLKSSLFGEWKFPGLEKPALILIILFVFILLTVFSYILLFRKSITANYSYIFLLNLIIPFILAVKFRMDYPVACSQDFRYIAPVLISISYFLGKTIGQNKIDLKAKALKYFASISLAAFCVISVAFVLLLADYG